LPRNGSAQCTHILGSMWLCEHSAEHHNRLGNSPVSARESSPHRQSKYQTRTLGRWSQLRPLLGPVASSSPTQTARNTHSISRADRRILVPTGALGRTTGRLASHLPFAIALNKLAHNYLSKKTKKYSTVTFARLHQEENLRIGRSCTQRAPFRRFCS
jgi:hypothetical protein